MHFDIELPEHRPPASRAARILKVEVVPTVGGASVRNKLWGSSLRTWEVPFPNMKLDDPDFIADR
jgi:hypothetical protein